jgi:polysaccharide deacetylase 2 family uncharacterized protein YibQ
VLNPAALVLVACLAGGESPAIALIIDDLGNRPDADRAALELPGPPAYAILPFTPQSAALAARARRNGAEVLLHLPMEADARNHLLGPGALLASMTRAEFTRALHAALREVPYIIGVNNHMGSRLTRDGERMGWLMAELAAAGGLLFIDSRTTPRSAAGIAARRAHVPYAARDVFLDNRRDEDYVDHQFDLLVAHAVRNGEAIGIAHPHAVTLAVLTRRLRGLSDARIVPLAEVVRRRQCRERAPATAPPSVAPATAALTERAGDRDHAEHAE